MRAASRSSRGRICATSRPVLHVRGVTPIGSSANVLAQPPRLRAAARGDDHGPRRRRRRSGEARDRRARDRHRLQVASLSPMTPSRTCTARATTGDSGNAKLTLLDGAQLAASYRLRVVPPGELDVSASCTMRRHRPPAARRPRLPSRVALRGIALSTSMANRSGTSRSRRAARCAFCGASTRRTRASSTNIPAATTTTPESGDFVLLGRPFRRRRLGRLRHCVRARRKGSAPNWASPTRDCRRDRGTHDRRSCDDVRSPMLPISAARVVDRAGQSRRGHRPAQLFNSRQTTSCARRRAYAPRRAAIPTPDMGSQRVRIRRPW